MKPLSQSLADATRIIGALVPRGCDSLTFQDGPANGGLTPVETSSANGDMTFHGNGRVVVVPARWPGGIGETPAFEGATSLL